MSGHTKRPVVVGLDHTPAGLAAVRHAYELAASSGAALHVVHAFELPTRPDVALEADLAGERLDARHRAQRWLNEAIGQQSDDVTVKLYCRDGLAEQMLLRAADAASMVVVGEPQQRGRAAFPRSLAASVDCPVICVDEYGRASEVAVDHRDVGPTKRAGSL